MTGSSPAIPLFIGSLILLIVVRELRTAHRRTALNRALHELRRPLQVLALSGSGPTGSVGLQRLPGFPNLAGAATTDRDSTLPVWQAIRALGDLDRELNGGSPGVNREELIACRLMADSCVRRWQSRAHLAGAEVQLRWIGPDALVRGDGAALSGALENLIVNSIEHGGPEITVNAFTVGRKVRIEVLDNGRSGRPDGGRGSPSEVIARLRGAERHGHGLDVVGRTARRHGGKFEIELTDTGSKAVIVLPVGAPAAYNRGAVRVNW